MAEVAAAAIAGADLAKDIGSWICKNRSMDEAKRPDRLKGIEIPPMNTWSSTQISGRYVLSFGSDSIHAPKRGIGLTADPHDPCVLEFNVVGEYTSIKCNGKYLFAGDQATVKVGKDKVGDWERFKVYHTTIDGKKLCTIKCKRDGEYWYIDEEGMVRHRNAKEKGFKCHVFYMQKR